MTFPKTRQEYRIAKNETLNGCILELNPAVHFQGQWRYADQIRGPDTIEICLAGGKIIRQAVTLRFMERMMERKNEYDLAGVSLDQQQGRSVNLPFPHRAALAHFHEQSTPY